MNKPSKKLLTKLVLIATVAIGQAHADNSFKTGVNSKPALSAQENKAQLKQTMPTKAGIAMPKTTKPLKRSSPVHIKPRTPAIPSQPALRKKLGTSNLEQGQSNIKGMKELNGFKRLNPADTVKQPGLARPMPRKGNNGNSNQPGHNGTIGRGEVIGKGANMRANPAANNTNNANPSTTPSTRPAGPVAFGNTATSAKPSTSARDEETFVLSNERHVPRTVNGNQGQPNDNGGVTYSDGRRADPGPKGSTIFYNADGSVQSTASAAQEASPSQSSTGQDTFTLSNGQQVPASNGTDAGTADSSGGVTYESGRRVSADPDTGETVATNPDGSERSRHAAPPVISTAKATESSSGEATYELSNGQLVPKSINGDSGKPDGKGGVTYGSGRRISVDQRTGETVATNANGTERSRTAAPASVGSTGTGSTTESTDANGTPSYQLGNGEHVPQTNEDGSPAQLNADGSVTYTRIGANGEIETSTIGTTADGMTVTETEGEMTFRFGPKDRSQSGVGNIERVAPSGSSYGGNGDTRGGTSIHHGLGGTPDTAVMENGGVFELAKGDQVMSDGSIRHGATGDIYSTDPSTGETVITRPDGTEDRKPAPSGSSSGGNGQSSSGQSNEESGNEGEDSNDDAEDDNSDDDNSDDGGDDTGSEGDDGGDDTGSEGEDGATEYREDGNSYNRAPETKVVEDFVAKKTGQTRDVETGQPGPCGEDDGSGRVAEPSAEGGPNCIPGRMPGEGEEGGGDAPTAGNHMQGNVGYSNEDPRNTVINPSGFEESREEMNHALDTLEDIGGAVNPGPAR